MNDEYGVDLDEVFKVISTAEVLVVRFHLIQERLLVDFRVKPGAGPYIGLVPKVDSVEERFRSIERLRPEFMRPSKVMSFHWPRSMPVLMASGTWQHLVDRMGEMGGHEAMDACGGVMDELVRAERKEITGAIRGAEHYQTLWERTRA
jgi:hypothetical protein